jgi:hypothetical protein
MVDGVSNIAVRPEAEVLLIEVGELRVDFAGKHTFMAQRREGLMKAS